jgi:hypothetical protein
VSFKFRKQIKRGLTTNVGQRGVRPIVDIPGSRLSYTTRTAKSPEGNSSLQVPPADEPLPVRKTRGRKP